MQLTDVISLILFMSAVVLPVAAAIFAMNVVRGRNRGRLLSAPSIACDGFGRVGVTVICGGRDVGRIASLLAVEYPYYEVVVAVDSCREPDVPEYLRSTYCMTGVDYAPSYELSPYGVRALYRSVKRCYRRLVVVDVAGSGSLSEFDAAVGVASYDYVLPLPDHVRLMPGAVERLVIELCLSPVPRLKRIESAVGAPVTLYARENVIDVGGFVSGNVACRRDERRVIYEPVASYDGHVPAAGARMAIIAVTGIAVTVVTAVLCSDMWVLAAVALAFLFVILAVRAVAPLANPDICDREAFMLTFRNFCEKNLLL